MTAKLTEERIEELRKSPHCRDSEWNALCDAALRDVRARGQKPVAWRVEHSAGVGHWHLSSYKPEVLPEGVTATPLFPTPQPTYADGKRDGLLAAAKVCNDAKDSFSRRGELERRNGATTCQAAIEALADKEPT